MMGQIPQSFIEDLLARTDIVEVISARQIPLRRAGANFVASCPFHTEKTPSFTVSPVKQLYHCFGCGVSGDAIRFLTEYEGLHFVEAVEVLASRIGLTVPIETKEGSNKAQYTAIYDCLAKAAAFYQAQLRQPAVAHKAHEYLKSRGLTGKIAKHFGLGFAPSAWDALINYLGNDKNQVEELLAAGLVVKNKKDANRFYDRFRDRILFPIRDRRGRVVGFGGRIIGAGEPKYLNTPETVVFSKGQELYGLYEARVGNRALSSLLVVEGYMDVVSLVQAGIKNVVATLGTALTEKQVDILFRQASELLFCFDGDKAGKEAARRALNLVLPHMKEGRRVRFILLPEGEDPDSFVRKRGHDAFLACMDRATPLSDFLFDELTEKVDLKHLDGRAQLIALAKPFLNLLPAGVFQQMLYDRLSELTGVDSERIQGKRQGNRQQHSWSNQRIEKHRVLPATLANRALAILLKNRGLISLVGNIEEFKEADPPATHLLCAIIEILRFEKDIGPEAISERLPPDYVSLFTYKELNSIADSIPEGGMEQEFLGAIQRLRGMISQQALELLLMRAGKGEISLEEKERLNDLLKQKEKNWVD